MWSQYSLDSRGSLKKKNDLFKNSCPEAKTPPIGDGQGGVVCCGLWGNKESDTTE